MANIQVGHLLDLINEIAPWRLAADWDNVGLMVGSKSAPAGKVALALDPTPETALAAAGWGADVLLTHHPLIFRPLKTVDLEMETGRVIEIAIRSGLSIVSAHTNFDASANGVPRVLARRLGLANVDVLEPASPIESENREIGFGCIGELEKPVNVKELCLIVKEKLDVSAVRATAIPDRPVSKIALLPGSGGSYLGLAKSRGADVLITGDVGYHQAREAEFAGICLIDAGHFGTELPSLGALASDIGALAKGKSLEMELQVLVVQNDPWVVL